MPALRSSWANGQRVTKLIGFDCTEDHRTYADAKGLKLCPEKGLPSYSDRYEVRYPLREWGLDRAACGRIITGAGLPLPPKSSCFFCPAMQKLEILQLAKEEPDLYALALEMERLYRAGPHFRGDNFYIVRGRHRTTKEVEVFETLATSVVDARQRFRVAHDDTVSPYRYDVSVSQAVVGLGRHFTWKNVKEPMDLPVVQVSDGDLAEYFCLE